MKLTGNWGDVVTPRSPGDQTCGGVPDWAATVASGHQRFRTGRSCSSPTMMTWMRGPSSWQHRPTANGWLGVVDAERHMELCVGVVLLSSCELFACELRCIKPTEFFRTFFFERTVCCVPGVCETGRSSWSQKYLSPDDNRWHEDFLRKCGTYLCLLTGVLSCLRS